MDIPRFNGTHADLLFLVSVCVFIHYHMGILENGWDEFHFHEAEREGKEREEHTYLYTDKVLLKDNF